MLFLSQTYSVLLVSSLEKLNTSLLQLLPGTEYHPVTVVKSVTEARRRTLEQEFDLVLVNAPLPDSFGLRFALDTAADSRSAVLLTVRQEQYEDVYLKALEAGVPTLARPTTPSLLSQQLRTLCAVRERLRRSAEREMTVEEKVKEMRLINRAKWLLIEQKGLSEAEAHQQLRRQAMDQRLSIAEVARRLLHE